MRRWLTGAALGLALAVSAAADDKPKKDDPPPKQDGPKTPAERLKAIKKEVTAAETAHIKAARDLNHEKKEDAAKAEQLYKEFARKQEAGFAAALEIAKADPKSDAAFAALNWLLTNPQAFDLRPVAKTAMELMTEYHATNPKVAPALRTLNHLSPAATASEDPKSVAFANLLKAVREKNPNPIARGYAAMGFAVMAINKHHQVEHQNAPDAEKWATAAETELEAVIKDYGDVKGATDVGDWATGELFELRNLRVGKVAPDIEGEDLDGVKFKLSDYRGKVVVIDFWGDW